MAWTANLDSAIVANGVATIVIKYADGTRTLTRQYQIGSPGDQFVEKQAAQEIRNFEALDAYVASLVTGPITPYKVPDPTADEQAATNFFAMQRKLIAMQSAVATGTLKADDPGLADIAAQVKAAFKPEYTTDFRWVK